MSTIQRSPSRGRHQMSRKPSDAPTGHLRAHSNDSRTSSSSSSPPPSPTPASSRPSLRAIEISTAFGRVHKCFIALQSALSSGSGAMVKTCVKKFQNEVTTLFRELRHLPDNVLPTPALISAIQGCSFEVHCFISSAERSRVGRNGWGERQQELTMALNEAMGSMCLLLELAAQAIEDAEAERDRLEESTESDTRKAERDFGSGTASSIGGRPFTWLVPVANDPGSGPEELRRGPLLAQHLRKVSSRSLGKLTVEPTPPLEFPQPAFPRKEPLIPMNRPSKGKYDVCHLRKSVHFHRTGEDTQPLRDSLAVIGHSAPFTSDLPIPDPEDLDAPYVEYNPDNSVKKANLRGLVGMITSGNAIEHEEFVSMVLTTFRLFASGRMLADALYLRYTEQQPEWLSNKGRLQFEWARAQKRMKGRVATVLHLWLELHWKPEDMGAIVGLWQLVETMEEDSAFHAQSLRMSLERIGEEKGYHGRRFRREERYKPKIIPPVPTAFAARNDLAALATESPSEFTVLHLATPEGVEEFARMMTMAESKYYRKLSPENFVHYKSEQTLRLRRDLGDFEQRYKAWIIWTIVTPEDPIERARVIKFWFEVAKFCVQCRNYNTAYQITCVLGDPEFEKMAITRQVLEQLDKSAIFEFWKVCRLYENEAWWGEINSSSLPAIPVSHILIRWRIYIEECGLRGLCKQTSDFSLPEFKSKGRIDVGSFLNLADLIWDIERTYEPHTFVQVSWIEDWFFAQVFAPHITDFGLETRHFKTGVAKDNPVPVVPDTVLAKLVAMLETKLRRKKRAKLIPLVPKKPSAELIKKVSANKLRKPPSGLNLHPQSQPPPSSSRPGTPTLQLERQNQRSPNKLRKRDRSLTVSSSEETPQGLPVQRTPPPPARVQGVVVKERVPEAVPYRPTARINLGPPPSPSNGKRFQGRGRRSSEVMIRPSRVGTPTPPVERGGPSLKDWEMV